MESHATPAFVELTVQADAGLSMLQSVAVEQLAKQGFDAGHDLAHSHRVAAWTLRLGQELDPREAIAAALLHDIVNLPKNHPERSTASTRSAQFAEPLLPKAGFEPAAVTRICEAIESHSYSRAMAPTSELGCALQDADRLETLGSIGLMRVFSTGARMGARYFHPQDPWAEARELNDLSFSIDHFATKLLKLPETMKTPRGRMEATRRAERLREFIRNLADELGRPPPSWL